MNWDAIGAVGEIVGAIAVVVSLLYLATQIRTSNRAAKQSATQELMSGVDEIVSLIAPNAELSDIMNRGNLNPTALTETESTQYLYAVAHNVFYWERIYYMEKHGEVDPWVIEKFKRVRQFNWQYPGYRKHISEFGWNYSHEFLELAKQEIASTPIFEQSQM